MKLVELDWMELELVNRKASESEVESELLLSGIV